MLKKAKVSPHKRVRKRKPLLKSIRGKIGAMKTKSKLHSAKHKDTVAAESKQLKKHYDDGYKFGYSEGLEEGYLQAYKGI